VTRVEPIPVHVEQDSSGEIILVNRFPVTERDVWRVVDRWWTADPVDRLFVSVLFDGVDVVLMQTDGTWAMVDYG